MGISQSAERLQALWGLFSGKFKVTTNELSQEKTQQRCYENIEMEINGEKFKSLRKGRKLMKMWIITLQFQFKK